MKLKEFEKQFQNIALDKYHAIIEVDHVKIWDDDGVLIFDRQSMGHLTKRERQGVFKLAINELRKYINQ